MNSDREYDVPCRALEQQEAAGLSSVLPKHIQDKLSDGDACAIGAIVEKEMVGFGIFANDDFRSDQMECLFLYTMEQYRRQGVASSILHYAAEMFLPTGAEKLCINLTGMAQNTQVLHNFFMKEHFLPLVQDWHILAYDMGRITSNEFISQCRGNGSIHFQTLNRRMLSYMLHEDSSIPKIIKEIIRTEADWGKSLFYQAQGKLAAGVMVEENGADDVSVHALYINPHLKNRAVLLSMLASAVDNAKVKPSMQVKVYFYVDDSRHMEVYRQLFGAPDEDYRVERYEKELIAGSR